MSGPTLSANTVLTRATGFRCGTVLAFSTSTGPATPTPATSVSPSSSLACWTTAATSACAAVAAVSVATCLATFWCCSSAIMTASSSTSTPAMARPTAVSLIVSWVNSEMIAPRWMTSSRSDRLITSLRSAEISRTPAPRSRAETSALWTNSIAPTSTPRVGWAIRSTAGSDSNSLAMTTFCMLPPDKVPTGVVVFAPRMSKVLISA